MAQDNKPRTLPLEHVRIASTLDWYFNFADADLGLKSNHTAMVAAIVNPKEHTVATSDAAEDAMFRAIDAVRQFRHVSAVIHRLSKRDQRDLLECFARRRGPSELQAIPASERWFALSSPVVREFLRAHGHKQWTLEAAERLLIVAQRADKDASGVARVRVEALVFAENALAALLERFGRAERELDADNARVAKQQAKRTHLAQNASGSNPWRWS